MPENSNNVYVAPSTGALFPENQPGALPVLTPPENDTPAKESPAGESSIGEKIRRGVAGIIEKHGVKFRKGRGRPKADGTPGKSDVVLSVADGPAVADIKAAGVVAPVSPAGVVAPSFISEIDQKINDLFRKCLAGGAKGVTEGCNFVTRILAGKAGVDREFTEKTLERAKPEAEAVDNFAASVDLIIEKHKPKVKEGGEWWCLAMSTGRLMAPYAMIWLEFKKEIDRKKAAEAPAAAPAPKPPGK